MVDGKELCSHMERRKRCELNEHEFYEVVVDLSVLLTVDLSSYDRIVSTRCHCVCYRSAGDTVDSEPINLTQSGRKIDVDAFPPLQRLVGFDNLQLLADVENHLLNSSRISRGVRDESHDFISDCGMVEDCAWHLVPTINEPLN